MWGSILTEANTLNNFNFGFSTHKSDILLHLSQWQYWWWFWFSLFWTVYFFIIIRVLNKRTFTFNPVLNTSIRGHGKWGDFLVALIPLSWCGNILVNSNFILRMIEWQNESSLFTIRVQGKQWYWVYKFDAAAAQSIFAAPKNIGHNRWFVTTPTESYTADTYYQALNLGTQLEFKSLYYKYLSDDNLMQDSLNSNSLQTNGEFFKKFNIFTAFKPISTSHIDLYNSWYFRPSVLKKLYNFKDSKILNFTLTDNLEIVDRNLNFKYLSQLILQNKFGNELSTNTNFYDFDQVDDLSNFAANIAQQSNNQPISFIRGTLNKHVIDVLQNGVIDSDILVNWLSYKNTLKLIQKQFKKLLEIPFYRKKNLTLKEIKRNANSPEKVYLGRASLMAPIVVNKWLNIRESKIFLNLVHDKYKSWTSLSNIFSDSTSVETNLTYIKKPMLFNILFNKNSNFVEKTEDNELLWGFRQKKYKRFKKFFFNRGFTYDSKTLEVIKPAKPTIRQLKNNVTDMTTVYNDDVSFDYHLAVKYNRHRQELVPVNLARRLLRVKRTLVLPAHVNITLISNSYDVVHSWFIPGLGLKIDCVPGRSTHHTFYIDSIGFYYGQCAEICGRYHHHMPIRLCALSFEHFLVWWQKKGLKRLHRFNSLKNPDKTKGVYLHGVTGKNING